MRRPTVLRCRWGALLNAGSSRAAVRRAARLCRPAADGCGAATADDDNEADRVPGLWQAHDGSGVEQRTLGLGVEGAGAGKVFIRSRRYDGVDAVSV